MDFYGDINISYRASEGEIDLEHLDDWCSSDKTLYGTIPVPVAGSGSSLASATPSVSDPFTVIANTLRLILQKLKGVQEEVHHLMKVHAKLTQEV